MIILNDHENLVKWVEIGINGYTNGYDGQSKAIGQVINGKLVRAVTYSNFKSRADGSFYDVEMGVYNVDKKSVNRYYLNVVFSYPFSQLKLDRVTTICSADDEGIMMFNKRLGFKLEGIHRKAWVNGGDSASFGMLSHECKWLRKGGANEKS